MDNLPVEVIREIYEYDSTYKIKFDKADTIDCPYIHLSLSYLF